MKARRPYILISIIPSAETNHWSSGAALLNALVRTDHRLMPEKLGNTEPLSVSVGSVAECEPYWAVPDGEAGTVLEGNAQSFMWKRGRPLRSSGHVIHKYRNIYGAEHPGWIIFKSEIDRKIGWYELFRSLCVAFEPIYATLHDVAVVEQNSSGYTEEERYSYGFNDHVMGLPYASLEKGGLANISWANYFGPELKCEARQEEIQNAQFPVEHIGDGIMIRVTENLLDIEDDFPEFSRRRSQLRKLFREGVFRITREPSLGNDGNSET